MAIIGLSVEDTFTVEYSKDPAKGTPDATRFILKPIPIRVLSAIRDTSSRYYQKIAKKGDDAEAGDMSIDMFLTRAIVDTVRVGLKGWENFNDQKGNPIPFKTKQQIIQGIQCESVTEECISSLPFSVIQELSEKLNNINSVDKEEEKN